MQFLQLPQTLFRCSLESNTLCIKVRRKYLPVSKSHGNSPFVLTFLIKPTEEVLVTTQFSLLSKSPKQDDFPKKAPKRVRRVPKPFVGAYPDEDHRISDVLFRPGRATLRPTLRPVPQPPPKKEDTKNQTNTDAATPSPPVCFSAASLFDMTRGDGYVWDWLDL
jgi:hypothetical protein